MSRQRNRRQRKPRRRSDAGPPPEPGPEFEQFRRRLSYPSELPITDHRDELLELLASEQVLIVAGETGSGKSTQLPKLCVEAGRGSKGLIGHTQPRRLAARSIAERVAEETDTAVGDMVGYAVRFNDRIGAATRIKLMTDGILLAELQRDRLLRRYDTIIIDEAHERSLNIDFILGYLKQILPKRPDLHVVVTSATIDTERFSQHFDGAPIVEVSGRTYPVELRYRPYDEPAAYDDRAGTGDGAEPLSQTEAIARAVQSLIREGPGDILVFLPGERDIRETAEALVELNFHDVEIFPLFARLSAADQHRVFRPHPGRRIVLATNVAETSVTVPGIRSVIDPGTARISRYNKRTKMQRLPIEPISQASADQRAGRCGRIGPGICVRLYSESDFEARDEFTEPEIQRTNLASVILQMAALDLGDIDSFPFIDPPDHRSIGDGIALLEELDALDPEHAGTRDWLTPMGRELARLPVDPRFARMLIEAADHGALAEVLIIVAALSIQDPRERPRDDDGQATALHRRFENEDSDFLTLLTLWRYLEKQRSTLSANQFRKLCRREFLNHNRVREWQDTRNQLQQMTRELGYTTSGNRAEADTIHRCLLSGLLSHVGLKDAGSDKAGRSSRGRGQERRPPVEFLGARGSRFRIARTSTLAKKAPNWVMAAELIETNRLWAHTVGPVDPRWIEELGYYLVTRSYDTPIWSAVDGVAYTIERVTLYGLPVVSGRRITVGSVNPAQGRELFIHHALVEDEWNADHDFVVHNRELRAELAELEQRARRRDLTAENQALHAFFDHRLPDDITSAAHFDAWWRTMRESDPRLLHLSVDQLLAEGAELADPTDFPDFWTIEGGADGSGPRLELAYEFDGASPRDGLSVHVPVEVLNQLEATPFEWSVPGYRRELLEALIRSLPKSIRKDLAPIGHTVDRVLKKLHSGDRNTGDRPPAVVLTRILGPMTGVEISPEDFDWHRVPDHLRPTFRVIDADRRLLAEGKDLAAVKDLMATHTREAISKLSARSTNLERSGIVTWDFGSLPLVVEPRGTNIKAYPGLVDDGDSVSIRLFPTDHEQHEATWPGVRRLLRLHVGSPVRTLDRLLDRHTKFALVNPPVQSKVDWYNDAIDCALDEIMVEAGGPPRDEIGFERLVATARSRLGDDLAAVARIMDRLVPGLVDLKVRIERLESSDGLGPSAADAIAHSRRLAYPGLLTGFGMPRLDDLVRYVDGLNHRIDKLIENPELDLRKTAELIGVERRHADEVAQRGLTPTLEDLQWQLEELRLATFAQQLRDPKGAKVSARRIERALGAMAD